MRHEIATAYAADINRRFAPPTPPPADFVVINHGTLVSFQLLTAAAREWWGDNVADSFSAQNHVAEPRYAGDVIDGMIADGLNQA